MTDHLDLAGRCAVITGAASGIGRALAREAVSRRMDVALCDIDAAGVAAVAEELRGRHARVHARRVDVADAADVAAFGAETLAQFSSIGAVFANAGLMRLDSAISPNPDVWQLTVGVDLLGVVHTAAALLRAMIARGEAAQFIITGSNASYIAAPGISAYCAAKHALWAYAEALEMELRQEQAPVSASLLAPPRVASGITDQSAERARISGGERAEAEYRKLLMPPELMASFTFDQVVKRRFWILPSLETLANAATRFDALVRPAVPHEDAGWEGRTL